MKKLLLLISLFVFFSPSTYSTECPELSKKIKTISASRNSQLREAKRDAGIPSVQTPLKTVHLVLMEIGRPVVRNGQVVKTREYYFRRRTTNEKGEESYETVVVQEHTLGHQFGDGGKEAPHFNVRPTNAQGEVIRHGKVPGTKSHYYVDTGTK